MKTEQRLAHTIFLGHSVLTSPDSFWQKELEESKSLHRLFTNYGLLLMLIPVLGVLLGAFFQGVDFLNAARDAAWGYASLLVLVFLTSVILERLLNSYGISVSFQRTVFLVTFSLTPLFLSGFFLALVPSFVGIVFYLAAALYSGYLFINALSTYELPETSTLAMFGSVSQKAFLAIATAGLLLPLSYGLFTLPI